MKVKCEYCGSYISDTEEKCPNCGAVNEHLQRKAIGTPTTIAELKQWYKEHDLPIQDITRFFIGVDYKEPKAFGIYQDKKTGNFIVYKNKSDGTRSIRYEGKDESYAVNEIYLKLKEEIINQKRNNLNRKSERRSYVEKANNKRPYKPNLSGCLMAFIIFIFILIFVTALFSRFTPSRGYYSYNDSYYYYQSGTWYEYDDYNGWYESYAPDDLKDNYSDYYESNHYYSSYGIDDFSSTDYYEAPSSSSSSSDSDWDSDWDSGSSWDSSSSWDSGSTDWDSDW